LGLDLTKDWNRGLNHDDAVSLVGRIPEGAGKSDREPERSTVVFERGVPGEPPNTDRSYTTGRFLSNGFEDLEIAESRLKSLVAF